MRAGGSRIAVVWPLRPMSPRSSGSVCGRRHSGWILASTRHGEKACVIHGENGAEPLFADAPHGHVQITQAFAGKPGQRARFDCSAWKKAPEMDPQGIPLKKSRAVAVEHLRQEMELNLATSTLFRIAKLESLADARREVSCEA